MISAHISLFYLKLKLSGKTIVWVLSRWHYALFASLIAITFFELLHWVMSLSTFAAILFSNKVSIISKVHVLLSPYQAVATTSGTTVAILYVCLSVIQGISAALLVYVVRNQKALETGIVRNSLVGLLAIIGLGCPSCGTSVLTPLIAIFISGSAVSVSETLTRYAIPAACIIGLYGVYVLGQKAATVRAYAAQQSLETSVQ